MNEKLHDLMHQGENLAGGILIAAALTKTAFPGQSAMIMAVFDFPSWIITALIQFELALGVLLISKVTKTLAAVLGLVTFLTFASFSAYRAVVGFETCGCFGAMKVNPWFGFAIDILLAVLLSWKLFKRRTIQTPLPGNVAFAAASYVILGTLAIMVSHTSLPHTLVGDEGVVADGSLVVLEPEKWFGKKLPIASDLSPNVDLSIGSWIVLLFHHECPNCQAALPLYERLAQQLLSEGASRRIALVEVPPYGPNARHGAAISLRLPDKVEWFVQAPVEIQISDGIVTGSSRDLHSIAELRQQGSPPATIYNSPSSVSRK